MIPFDFQPRTRVVFGAGQLGRLGDLAQQLEARRALLVSDPGVVAAGHTLRGLEALRRAGIEVELYDQVAESPTTADVERAAAFARSCQPDLLVGLGGGSSLDCCKGVNFLYTNGGRMQDYWGVGKATQPMLPMIAVPTTAGTGSESQSFALITDAQTHVKMACGDPKAACRIALLDPELTLTQPRRLTALTGIDALAHAVETYVTRRRNPLSLIYSREAWRLLSGHYCRVLDRPDDLAAREAMQWGACLAGFAIEYSMLGAAHALANPLSAAYGMVHGQAVGLMLPHVVRFNGSECGPLYAELLQAGAGEPGVPDVAAGVAGLADFLAGLLAQAELPQRLSACGVSSEQLPALAADAARQWTGTFNPRAATAADFEALYREAF